MRDSMRKKRSKTISSHRESAHVNDLPAFLGIEAPSTESSDDISRKRSKSSASKDRKRRSVENESTNSLCESPEARVDAGDGNQSFLKGPKFRKPVAKTPHTFELEHDLKPAITEKPLVVAGDWARMPTGSPSGGNTEKAFVHAGDWARTATGAPSGGNIEKAFVVAVDGGRNVTSPSPGVRQKRLPGSCTFSSVVTILDHAPKDTISTVPELDQRHPPTACTFSSILTILDQIPVEPEPTISRSEQRQPPASSTFSRVVTTLDRIPIRPRASCSFSRILTTLDRMPMDPLPSSPKSPTSPYSMPNRTRGSAALRNANTSAQPSNPCRFTPPLLTADTFNGKVIVITNGASPIGQSLVRHFHSVGCRIIFGDYDHERAKKLISSLPPPHVVHFNQCDTRRYNDMLQLFKLGVVMYGRVDHAIFGIGEDGGQSGPVGLAETGWFESNSKSAKVAIAEVENEPTREANNTISASSHFARIALAYLRHSPGPARKANKTPKASSESVHSATDDTKGDRSLTFITSVAAFRPTPGLPVYQTAQHTTLALLRGLCGDSDPRVDFVRVNAVATNMMVPRMTEEVDGRVSVSIPPDTPEDIGRVVAGVVAASRDAGGRRKKQGIWLEGREGEVRENHLHGRLLYAVGERCWDIQGGLDRSEPTWIGKIPSYALAQAMGGGADKGSQWLL